MSYTPPAGLDITFSLSGASYAPPAGDAVNFALGETISTAQVIAADLRTRHVLAQAIVGQLQQLYGLDPKTAHRLAQAVVLHATAVDSLIARQANDLAIATLRQLHLLTPAILHTRKTATSSCTPLPDYIKPTAQSPGILLQYKAGSHVTGETGLAWQQVEKRDADACRVPWNYISNKCDAETACGYAEIPPKDNEEAWLYGNVTGKTDGEIAAQWLSLLPEDMVNKFPWGSVQRLLDADIQAPYTVPPAKDEDLSYIWETLLWLDKDIDCNYFNSLPNNDLPFKIRWGKRDPFEHCVRRYVQPRGDQLVFNLQPLDAPPQGNEVLFYFDALEYDWVCDYDPGGGPVDPWNPPQHEIIIIPAMEVYSMHNNISVVRVSDRAPVEVMAVSVTLDMSSWAWGFQATLGTREALNLVVPQNGVPVTLEVNVNGWLWTVMVENWRESKSFGKATWTVQGRSESAQLASPYAPAKTYLEANNRTAVQLVEQELQNTGWSVDWQPIDWLVPGGCYSYNNQTPMQAIQMIAEAAGAVIQTDATAKTLHVVSRYAISPWQWSQATPDVILPDSVIKELSRDYKPSPAYNGIYVSGQTQGGVTVFVKRAGTDGAIQMPQVVHPLITSREIGQERGRIALASCGAWESITLATQLAQAPNTPGLILPGKLLQVVENGVSWIGQVTGVNVAVSNQNGVYVAQQLEVERYYG